MLALKLLYKTDAYVSQQCLKIACCLRSGGL